MVSDAEAAVGEIGDDDSESTCGDVEIREDGDDLVVGHPVERFTEVNSDSQHSSRVLGRIIKVSEDEVHHSDYVVGHRAPRKATQLI